MKWLLDISIFWASGCVTWVPVVLLRVWRGHIPRAEWLFPGALQWLQPCREGHFVGLARVREKMCLLAHRFSCPTLFAQGLFSTLGEPCHCWGPVMQVQPCGRQEAPVLCPWSTWLEMVQHVELAFPRDEECSEPWGLTFKQVNPICLQWLNCEMLKLWAGLVPPSFLWPYFIWVDVAGPAGEERLECLGNSIISKTVVVSNYFVCPSGEKTQNEQRKTWGWYSQWGLQDSSSIPQTGWCSSLRWGFRMGLVTSSSHIPQIFLSQLPDAFGAAMVVH